MFEEWTRVVGNAVGFVQADKSLDDQIMESVVSLAIEYSCCEYFANV